MLSGPGGRSKLSHKKAHRHPLTLGKEYIISTSRDLEGAGQIAFIAYLFKGKKRHILYKVDHLLPGAKYSVEFKAGQDESLVLTYWHKSKGTWIQLNSERFEHDT